MIESIIVENFQALQKLEIEFDPHITIITGETDAGKSSLMRAIEWTALNMAGDQFVRVGARDATVRLRIDRHEITRSRGKSGNTYALDGSEFKAFGNGVPSDIAAIVNMTDVNFEGQMDPIFWFSETAGEVSRRLNAIVDLGIIDKSLAKIAGVLEFCRVEVKVSKKNLDKAKEKVAELAWVAEADADYAQVEKLFSDLTACEEDVKDLADAVEKIEELVLTRDKHFAQAQEIRDIGVIGSKLKKVAEQTEPLRRLCSAADNVRKTVQAGYPDITNVKCVVDKIEACKTRGKLLRSLINDISKSSTVVESGYPSMSELCQLFDQAMQVKGDASSLARLLQQIQQCKASVVSCERAKTQAEEEIKTEMAGMCPVCGKEL